MKEILVSSDHLEDRVALLEEGHLMDIFIARGDRTVGSIYKGKVANVLPGMQAAFVDIGMERNAFLSIDDALPGYPFDEVSEGPEIPRVKTTSIEQILKPRQETLVQVIKEPIGTKGGRITTNISLPGRYLVLLPFANYIGLSRRLGGPQERERLKSVVEQVKPENMGVIIRTAAEGKEEALLKQDLDSLVKLWEKIQQRSVGESAPSLIHKELGLIDRALRDMLSEGVEKFMVDSRSIYEKVLEFAQTVPDHPPEVYLYEASQPLFELYNLESEIEKLLFKKVWLACGGYIIIEPTEALTVIDVNTGKYVGSHSLDETILKTNLEAAQEIARQIRLRDLSGIIVIDFIDMQRKEDRKKLLLELDEHFKSDRVRAAIFGMTNLGLVEITRKRAGKNLDRILQEECFYCGGGGRIWNPESVGIRLEREIRRDAAGAAQEGVLVIAHPQVAFHLAGWEGERVAGLEQALGKDLFLRGDPNLHLEKYRIHWEDSFRLKDQLRFLREDLVLEEEIQGTHPMNPQSGVILVDGQILEVVNAGNRVGEKVRVRVGFVSRSYALGEILP